MTGTALVDWERALLGYARLRTSCLDCLELWQRAREARGDLDLGGLAHGKQQDQEGLA